MTFDLIIPTYNREEKINRLVDQVKSLSIKPDNIIVVDSSEISNNKLLLDSYITYIKSSEKNQPYQRYLGWSFSKSDIIVYMDDDMEIVDLNIFSTLSNIFSNRKCIGVSLYWKNKPETKNSLMELHGKLEVNKSSALKKWLTFYPNPDEGQMGYCGIRGKYPNSEGNIEFFSGGAFALVRSVAYQNFNFQLFNLYKNGLGKGEDSILGLTLTRCGTIFFEKKIVLWHNDEGESNYAYDLRNFNKRYIYSRLYLTLERQRLKNESMFLGRVYFHFFVMGRMIPYIINNPFNKTNKKVLKGMYDGWIESFFFKFNKASVEFEKKWRVIAQKDIQIHENRNINK